MGPLTFDAAPTIAAPERAPSAAPAVPLEGGIPLAQPEQDVQRFMEGLARSVRNQVSEHSANQLFAIAAGAQESLNPKEQKALAQTMTSASQSIAEARDITLSALTGSEISAARKLDDLSPEQQAAARENISKLLESATDEQLSKLVAQLHLPEQLEPRTREDAIQLLKSSDLLGKSFSNGEVALTVSEMLRDSGALPEVARQALDAAIKEARQALERLKDLVALIIVRELLAQAQEEKSSKRASTQDSGTLPIWFPETNMNYREVLEAFLDAAERQKDEAKNPWAEYGEKALLEQDRLLREKEESAERAETEHDENRRAALKTAIEQALKANPGFAASMAGVALQQLDFLSEIGRPTPIFLVTDYQTAF